MTLFASILQKQTFFNKKKAIPLILIIFVPDFIRIQNSDKLQA